MRIRLLVAAATAFVLWFSVAWAQNAQQDAQINEYVQMLQPVLWRELDFVRQVCDVPAEQRPKIKTAADAAVKKAARSVVQPQGRSSPTAASQMIRDGIHEAVKKHLDAEQLAAFTAEADKRAEALKDATILSAVSQLDGALYLNKEQREKIVAGLEKDWKSDWEQWLIMQRYSGQYYPQIPDQYVLPHLNPDQQIIWRSLQKVSIWGWENNNGRQQANDVWWTGKEPASKAKAKSKVVAKKAATP